MKEAFENYTKNYDMTDPDIDYKYKHSYRVMALAKDLAQKLELSDKDVELATIIGLYHDIGRFEEDKIFDSFGTHRTFDHGNYGKEILIDQKLLEEIPIEKRYYNLIATAVKNHNKYTIEDNLDKRTIMHCKIIRDADKIDILRSEANGTMTERYFDRKVKAKDLAESVKEEFYNNVQVLKRKKSKHSQANKILISLALIYDINYEFSIEYIKNNNILEKLYDSLEDKKGFKEYFDHIEDYIDKRYKNARN